MKKNLENVNFLNSQNYLLNKKGLRLKILAYFNDAETNINSINLFKKVNTIDKIKLQNINYKKNIYTIIIGHFLLFLFVFILYYLGSILRIIALIIGFFLIKGILRFYKIWNLKVYVGKKKVILVNSNLDNNIDKKINNFIEDNDIKNIKKVLGNYNLLNNQHYVFGKKLENKISKGFSSFINFKSKEKFYYFPKIQLLNKNLEKNILKMIIFYGFFSIIFVILFILSFLILKDYWYIGFLLSFGTIIYLLFFRKIKLKDYKIVYDKNIVYFIKK